MAMDNNYFIINSGSTSKKYALYAGELEIFYAHFEEDGDGHVVSFRVGEKEKDIKIDKSDFEEATKYSFDFLISEKIIESLEEIDSVGVRIVAPGSYFLSHKIVNEEYIAKLAEVHQEAPLHIEPVVKEVGLIKNILGRTPIIGISDSAFHNTESNVSRKYSIPKEDVEDFDIYRFGYHGISTKSILRKVEGLVGSIPEKTIVCHLGGGSSITALKNGETVKTSMGFTPLEGMVMATRIGDIDAGAVLHLARKKEMTLNDLEEYFNNKCGLLGLSGQTSDIRKLIELESSGNKDAKMALEALVIRVKRYIGEYIAMMNGADLLVFSATVGQRSFILREKICMDMDYLGIDLDKKLNDGLESGDNIISSDKSKIKIAVINTDETMEIARQTRKFIEDKK